MNREEELKIISREVNKMMHQQLNFYNDVIIPMVSEEYSSAMIGNILISFNNCLFCTVLYTHLLLFDDPSHQLDLILNDIKCKLQSEIRQATKRQRNYEIKHLNS